MAESGRTPGCLDSRVYYRRGVDDRRSRCGLIIPVTIDWKVDCCHPTAIGDRSCKVELFLSRRLMTDGGLNFASHDA